MGFQNGNDNVGTDSNRDANARSVGRTSVTSKFSNNTTKAQYERQGILSGVDTRGKILENYNCKPINVDGQDRNQASVGRTSVTESVLKGMNGGFPEESLHKTGPLGGKD